jgi:hypothetical protein
MECNLTKIYEYFSTLQFPKPKFDKLNKIDSDSIIAKNSRHIGLAFDGLIKNHLLLINNDKSYDGPFYRIYSKVEYNNISINKINCVNRKFDSTHRKLKNDKQIYESDYANLLRRTILDTDERNRCAEHIKDLITKFNFKYFLSKNHLITNFTPEINLNGKIKFRIAILEIIKDNEIIEIKSDVRFNGIKPEYIAQLCFYYFIIKWLHRYNNEIKTSILSDVNPTVLSIYYPYHDYLYKFDPSILFKDEDSILDLLDQEILEGNNLIKEIFSLAISTKKNDLKKINLFSKIEKRKLQLIQNLTEKHLVNNDGKSAREVMNRFSIKLESCNYFKTDYNAFLEISRNFDFLQNKLQLLELRASQLELKKTMLDLANNLHPEATYLTKIKSFFPLIEGSKYKYGYSFENKKGEINLTVKSFQLNDCFFEIHKPLNFKYFKIDEKKHGHFSLDFLMYYFIEDRHNFYALSGSIGLKDLDETLMISELDIPLINKLPFRSLPSPNTTIKMKCCEFGERIWNFVAYENVNLEKKEYKCCAKFIITDYRGQETKIWLKKGIGMVQREFPNGRIEWLIDFKINQV